MAEKQWFFIIIFAYLIIIRLGGHLLQNTSQTWHIFWCILSEIMYFGKSGPVIKPNYLSCDESYPSIGFWSRRQFYCDVNLMFSSWPVKRNTDKLGSSGRKERTGWIGVTEEIPPSPNKMCLETKLYDWENIFFFFGNISDEQRRWRQVEGKQIHIKPCGKI